MAYAQVPGTTLDEDFETDMAGMRSGGGGSTGAEGGGGGSDSAFSSPHDRDLQTKLRATTERPIMMKFLRFLVALTLIALIPGACVWGLANNAKLSRASDYCIVAAAFIAAGTCLTVGIAVGFVKSHYFEFLYMNRAGVVRACGHLLADPLFVAGVAMYKNKTDLIDLWAALYAVLAAIAYFGAEIGAYYVHRYVRYPSLYTQYQDFRAKDRSWGAVALVCLLAYPTLGAASWITALDGALNMHDEDVMEENPAWWHMIYSVAKAISATGITFLVLRTINLFLSVFAVYSATGQPPGKSTKARGNALSSPASAMRASERPKIPCAVDIVYNYVLYEVVDLFLFAFETFVICVILAVNIGKRKNLVV